VFVGAHSGYFGDYRGKFRAPMSLVWHAAMPLITRVVGYFPANALRLGEDIPAGFAMQWAARRTPDFRPSKKGKQYERASAMLKRHEELRGTALALAFSDDAFGTYSGLRRLLAIYPRLETTIEEITPEGANMGRIGHTGFFRPSAAAVLWPKVRDFITTGTQATV
jgi:predicted alpha/beta hydrolase